MGQINISNSNNRDAMVETETVGSSMSVRWLDERGRQAQNLRLLRATVDRDTDELIKQAGSVEKVSKLLIEGDPEIDIENYGRALSETSRVYIDLDKKIVHKVQEWEIVRNVDGTERERRPMKAAVPNTATETPLRWSGRLMKKAEVFNKFVFTSKLQVVHVNGLTFDFLYAMAKELDEKQSLMLVGAGQKSTQPLIFQRGGTPYRGFLEGRVQGEKYCLVLHLSNLELKPPMHAAPGTLAAANASLPDSQLKPATPAKAEAAKVEPKSEAKPKKPKGKK
jgi:hypothetical protein